MMSKTYRTLVGIIFFVMFSFAIIFAVLSVMNNYQEVQDTMERCHEKGWDGMKDVGGSFRTNWICSNLSQAEKDAMPEDKE